MDKKIETKSTPILSEIDIDKSIDDVRETAAETAILFMEIGILQMGEENIEIGDSWKEKFK